jgi:hypothetical protein
MAENLAILVFPHFSSCCLCNIRVYTAHLCYSRSLTQRLLHSTGRSVKPVSNEENEFLGPRVFI